MQIREADLISGVPREHAPPIEATPGGGLTLRSMLLALVVQVGVIFWVVRSEVTARTWISNWALPMPAVLVLLFLILMNRLLRRPWRQAELLVVYLTVTTTVVYVGYNFIQLLIPTIATPFYHATEENRWSRLHPYLPTWLTVRDPEALRGLFMGNSSVPWRVWIVPLTVWGVMILALAATTLSLNVLLSRQWIHRERITFPVATLPLEMTSPRVPLLSNRVLWLGFLLPAVGQSLCAFHYYWPAVPSFSLTSIEVSESFTQAPWTSLGSIRLGLTPFQMGLAFLAPTDVSFSVWFFFWLGKLERLLAFNLGYMDPNNITDRGAPYLQEQTIGAFLAMGAFLLWRAWDRTGSRRPREDHAPDSLGAVNRKWMTIVLVVAVTVLVGVPVAAGMAPWLAASLLGLYLLMVVTITRVRAEAGFPWVYGPHRWAGGTSTDIVGNSMGTYSLPPSQLALIGLFYWFTWDVRFTAMDGQFEALKIGDVARVRQRALVAWIAVATVVAVVVGMTAAVRDGYLMGWATAKTYGGVADGAKVGYVVASRWWDNPLPVAGTRNAMTALGGAVTLGLIAARQQFVWWPFNPIGYVMGATHTATMMWSYYFTAWALKTCLLRYGGMRLYRAVVPFFVGVILGDLATMATWSLATSILDVPVYAFV